MELNPNHPVTALARDHWHKFAAIVLWKLLGPGAALEITPADLEGFTRDLQDGAVALDARNNQLVLRLMDGNTAAAAAREAGGLPQ